MCDYELFPLEFLGKKVILVKFRPSVLNKFFWTVFFDMCDHGAITLKNLRKKSLLAYLMQCRLSSDFVSLMCYSKKEFLIFDGCPNPVPILARSSPVLVLNDPRLYQKEVN